MPTSAHGRRYLFIYHTDTMLAMLQIVHCAHQEAIVVLLLLLPTHQPMSLEIHVGVYWCMQKGPRRCYNPHGPPPMSGPVHSILVASEKKSTVPSSQMTSSSICPISIIDLPNDQLSSTFRYSFYIGSSAWPSCLVFPPP
jgi:hypothetical protein